MAGHVEPVPGLGRVLAGLAPGDVGGLSFRHAEGAEVLAVRAEDPDAARAGAPEVAEAVDLHAIRPATFAAQLREDSAAAEGAIGRHVKDADMAARGVRDVEALLIGREGQAVGAVEVRFAVASRQT